MSEKTLMKAENTRRLSDFSSFTNLKEKLKEKDSIGNKEYQKLNNVAKPTATNDLSTLLSKGFLERVRTSGTGTKYVLKK